MTDDDGGMADKQWRDPWRRARQAVAAQRTRWRLSYYQAAEGSGISHQTWRSFERGDTGLTGRVATAVSQRFGWGDDWPENPPEPAPFTHARAGSGSTDGGQVEDSADNGLAEMVNQLLRQQTQTLLARIDELETNLRDLAAKRSSPRTSPDRAKTR